MHKGVFGAGKINSLSRMPYIMMAAGQWHSPARSVRTYVNTAVKHVSMRHVRDLRAGTGKS
jgi:hypothetical protein